MLTLSFARLLRMISQNELNYSEFSAGNRKLLERFFEDNVLDYRVIGKYQKKVFCPDVPNLHNYLHHKHEIPSLDNYIAFLELEETERSDAVFAGSDSKLKAVNVFSGFLTNCYDDIICELKGAQFNVRTSDGTFMFISSYTSFIVPDDVTIVVVENHENFREINKQKYLFADCRPLFVWRYQNSNAIVEWLNSINNPYIHFGDFDIKGIHIYLSEFKNKIIGTRGAFLIPEGIEDIIQRFGEKQLYEKQKSLLLTIQNQQDIKLRQLIDLIIKYKKGVAQEILIKIKQAK